MGAKPRGQQPHREPQLTSRLSVDRVVSKLLDAAKFTKSSAPDHRSGNPDGAVGWWAESPP